MSTKKKRPVSFRLSEGAIAMLKDAARRTGRSDGETLEDCIAGFARVVVEAEEARRGLVKNPAALEEVRRLLAAIPASKNRGV